MNNWIARILFPGLDGIRRQREVRFLLLAVVLGLCTCAAVAGAIYYYGVRNMNS